MSLAASAAPPPASRRDPNRYGDLIPSFDSRSAASAAPHTTAVVVGEWSLQSSYRRSANPRMVLTNPRRISSSRA